MQQNNKLPLNQMIQEMLTLQDKMNERIHQNWRTKQYPWYRAIWVECAELMDHHGWKWWKKQTPHHEQIQLELVDIWHFGLSACLQRLEFNSAYKDQKIQNTELNNCIAELTDAYQTATQSSSSSIDLLASIEQFAEHTLQTHLFSPALFFQMTRCVNLSFEQLYQQYIGKNVLNFFRQDHGYQSGEYQKIWNGQEDNEHLADIIKQSHSIAPQVLQEYLYDELSKRYLN